MQAVKDGQVGEYKGKKYVSALARYEDGWAFHEEKRKWMKPNASAKSAKAMRQHQEEMAQREQQRLLDLDNQHQQRQKALADERELLAKTLQRAVEAARQKDEETQRLQEKIRLQHQQLEAKAVKMTQDLQDKNAKMTMDLEEQKNQQRLRDKAALKRQEEQVALRLQEEAEVHQRQQQDEVQRQERLRWRQQQEWQQEQERQWATQQQQQQQHGAQRNMPQVPTAPTLIMVDTNVWMDDYGMDLLHDISCQVKRHNDTIHAMATNVRMVGTAKGGGGTAVDMSGWSIDRKPIQLLLPRTVLLELDGLKKSTVGNRGTAARKAHRYIKDHVSVPTTTTSESSSKTSTTPETFAVLRGQMDHEMYQDHGAHANPGRLRNDEAILNCGLFFSRCHPGVERVCMISNDHNFCARAKLNGISSCSSLQCTRRDSYDRFKLVLDAFRS
jgi:hypothetical protein